MAERCGWRWRLALAAATALLGLLAVAGCAVAADPQLTPTPEQLDHAATIGETMYQGGEGGLGNGGAPCGSCHTIGSTGAAGGAQLGPRLDWVGTSWSVEAIMAWLAQPPTPTMSALYGPGSGNELKLGDRYVIAAYLKSAASSEEAAAARQVGGTTVPDHGVNGALLGLGAAVALILLALAGFAWRGRVRSVRARLVRDARLPTTRPH